VSRTESFPVTGPVELRVRNAAGRIEISTVDPDGDSATAAVDLTALESDPDAAELVDRAEVTASPDGRRIVVEVPERRGLHLGRKQRILVRVSVPAGSSATAQGASAHITVLGRYAAVDARTASGDVRVGEVTGTVEAHSASGEVWIDSGAAVVAHSASGNVHIGHASGDVDVHTASGDVAVGVAEASVRARSASGDVSVDEAAGGTVLMTAASGDLRIGVRSGVAARLDLTSHSGRVRSDLPIEDDVPSGGATLDITARTTSGDLLVRSAAR
jgi:DUF4097 and DUF4098 domain-containing protein YvlB